MTDGGELADRLPEDSVLRNVSVREGVQPARRRGVDDRLNPEEFLSDQRAKHAHVQVDQLGPPYARRYVVIGYDEDWNENERAHLTEDGWILDGTSDVEGSVKGAP